MRDRGKLSVSVGDLAGNQFLEEEIGGGMSSRAYSKDLRVRKLQQRNVKLQHQIIKIEQALSAASGERTQYGVRLPQIKKDVIRKQLENAYKMIKNYEYEINKRKKGEVEQTYVEQIRKYERILKEKESLSQKLRKETMEMKKASLDYVKLLKNDQLKKQYIEREGKLNADIKWLHEKIKRIDLKRNTVNANMEKQMLQIQKMEKQLLNSKQFDKNFLQTLRNRIINAPSPTMSKEGGDSEEEIEPTQERDEFFLPDDRNPESYSLLLSEVKLYRKLEKDYQAKVEMLIRQKEGAEQQNFRSRNRLLEAEYEIQRVENAIAELKKQVDPRALKPTKMDLIVEEKRKSLSSVKVAKPKITMAHNYRFGEVGQATKGGKRFIDRSAIGKNTAKIVGVTFYQKKEGEHELLGLRVMYLVGTARKKGLINILADMTEAQPNQFNLEEGDFVRSVDCMTNQKGRVVGLSMVSTHGVVLRGGAMTVNRHPIEMKPNQYPVCVYGCLLPDGVQMLGVEFVHEQ